VSRPQLKHQEVKAHDRCWPIEWWRVHENARITSCWLYRSSRRPYRPLKLYRTARFDTAGTTLTLDGGALDPVVGTSYHQLAMASRSMHRSQDFGLLQEPGPSRVRLALLEDRTGAGAGGLFDGVDTLLATHARGSTATRLEDFRRLLGAGQLFTAALAQRPETAPGFVDAWSWGWYGVLAGLVLAALSRRQADVTSARTGVWTPALGGVTLWITCGAAMFLRGALELRWAFASRFAGDLATSAFWLVYAAALVALGFGLERRAAGLVVAGIAIAKIAFYDL